MSAEGDAAGREAGGKSSTLDFEGLDFKLKLKYAKAPFKLTKAIGKNKGSEPAQVVEVLEILLGEEQTEKVWDAGLDMDQGKELMEALMAHYGMASGESDASPNS